MKAEHTSHREAGPLRRTGVIIATLGLTAGYSVATLARAACGRLSRERIDRWARRWAGALLRLVRVTPEVTGQVPDFNDGRRYIILSTHCSHYDIPVTFATLPGSIRMLAKRELFQIPLFGAAMRAAEFPAIDRRARRSMVRDLAHARQLMESGIVLWAAPQGTRSKDGQLLPFKKGCFQLAVQTDAVIVPLAIVGIHEVLPAGSLHLNLGQPVKVLIGEPLEAADFGSAGLAQLMEASRERLQGLLDQAHGVEVAPPASDVQPQAEQGEPA